ncbi:MAG TPA: hydrogenase maturation protease [Thermoanaerobaculia bacterium]
MRRVAVLGLGNVLMGDDAAGPYVLRLLEAGYEIPAEVDLRDLGTPGPELAHIVEGLDALIVVDTIRVRDGAPGDLRLLRRPDLVKGKVPERLSPHDPSLRGALLAAELLGRSPSEALLVGIVPGPTELGIGLSFAVREALPRALAEVVAELERLGVAVRRREEARPAEVWWESESP